MNQRVLVNVDGMTCTNCAAGVKRQLEKKGLKNVHVDFTSGEAIYDFDENVSVESVVNAINSIGYKASPAKNEKNLNKKHISALEIKLIISAVLTLPMLIGMVLPFDFLHNHYLHLILTIPVFIIGMQHFGRSAFNSLKSGIPNMDVLITLGSSAAFIYSLTGSILNLGPDFMFYETAASIITIVLFGNTLEHRSVKSTTSAIEGLTRLQQVKAKRIPSLLAASVPEVEEIDYVDIQENDLLLVNTGDQVPTDGEIVWGNCSVNESMLTGESMPIEKSTGSEVIGGSILESGSIKLRATKVGNNTVLAQIIHLVKNAQSDKPRLQTLADKISAIFVPVVVGIALVTFLLAYFAFDISLQNALLRGIAVLVISCPCALGLAIPTAVVVGVGMLARRGVLVKGGTTLDKLTRIKNMVFDKTGTITTGLFHVKNLKSYNAMNKDEIKSILYSIEKHSSHPIARSIVQTFKDAELIDFKEIYEDKGFGVRAIAMDDSEYKFGSIFMVGSLDHDEAEHDLYLTKQGSLVAGLDIEDQIKPSAKETVRFLKSMGIQTIMLSGDKKVKCEAIANKINLDRYHFEKLPNAKLEIIESYNKKAYTAMVGDGINDAPALTKADIGISLSDASNIAINAAQVILLKGKLSLIPKAIDISKLTMLTIKQNLFWAFFYNVIAIPIAAFGFLSPTIAALAMAFSDVFIVMNSLRMRSRKV